MMPTNFTAGISKPSPPKIVIAKPEDCGRTIHVEWNSVHTEYELQLVMANGRKERIIYGESFSRRNMHFFHGLTSNTVYEVRIRVKNAIGFGLWAKKYMKTVAGIVIYIDSAAVTVQS